ncbi:hypothetical protein OAO87_01390 [bacterium]|nr:hypothetical protein [bacterium]
MARCPNYGWKESEEYARAEDLKERIAGIGAPCAPLALHIARRAQGSPPPRSPRVDACRVEGEEALGGILRLRAHRHLRRMHTLKNDVITVVPTQPSCSIGQDSISGATLGALVLARSLRIVLVVRLLLSCHLRFAGARHPCILLLRSVPHHASLPVRLRLAVTKRTTHVARLTYLLGGQKKEKTRRMSSSEHVDKYITPQPLC